MLNHYFRDRLKDDPSFFKTVIFTCSTEIASSDEQQVETLNWHLSDKEINLIKKNMDDRKQNQIRLQRLAAWWQQRMTPIATAGRALSLHGRTRAFQRGNGGFIRKTARAAAERSGA